MRARARAIDRTRRLLSRRTRQICREKTPIENLSGRAIDSRNSFSAAGRLYDPIDRAKIPLVGRTNVANTFCDSYRAIPRPFGNAKIDFLENYVREGWRAHAHTSVTALAAAAVRPQGHIFAYMYMGIGSDEIPH